MSCWAIDASTCASCVESPCDHVQLGLRDEVGVQRTRNVAKCCQLGFDRVDLLLRLGHETIGDGDLALVQTLVHAVHQRLGMAQHRFRERSRVIGREGVDLDRADSRRIVDLRRHHPLKAPVQKLVVIGQPESRIAEHEVALRAAQDRTQIVVLGELVDEVARSQIRIDNVCIFTDEGDGQTKLRAVLNSLLLS